MCQVTRTWYIDALVNFGALEKRSDKQESFNWNVTWDGSVGLYVKLDSRASLQALEQKIEPFITRNTPKTEDESEKGFRVYFQAIDEIYLSPMLEMEFTKKGNPLHVYFFVILGSLLLIIAGLNYYCLFVADFDTRTKEIGVRKMLGARPLDVVLQVVIETFIIGLLSLCIAMISIAIIFPHIVTFLTRLTLTYRICLR